MVAKSESWAMKTGLFLSQDLASNRAGEGYPGWERTIVYAPRKNMFFIDSRAIDSRSTNTSLMPGNKRTFTPF